MRHVSCRRAGSLRYRFSGTAKRHLPHVRARFINHTNHPQRYATTLRRRPLSSTPPSITCPTGSANCTPGAHRRQCLSAVRASVPTVKHRFAKAIGTRVCNILCVALRMLSLCASSSSAIFSSTHFFRGWRVALIYTRLASRQCHLFQHRPAP